MPRPRTLLFSGLALGLGAASASAEENRLLPFWGQPFPSGFIHRQAVDPGPIPYCPGLSHRHWRGASPGRTPQRCPIVLHARG